MAKDKKFLNLFEYYMAKYPARGTQGGFQQNDVFKFNDNFKSDEAYESLPSNVKEIVDDFIGTGLHLRVRGISPESDKVTLSVDHGGGRYVGNLEIPCCLGEPVDFGVNLPPIPDAQKRKDDVNITPKEVEQDEENPSNLTDRGNGELSVTELTLEKESYTQQYL
jgi:hypothetical protein